MSKNVRMAILHIAVAAVCFIGALIFFNGRISMEKGSAVAELANPSYPVLEIGNDTSSYNLMAGYKEDIDLSLVRNQITLTNNKNAVILKLHDYDYAITAIQNTLYEKTTLYRRETQRSAGVRKGIKIKDKKSGRIFRIRRSSDHMVRRTSGYDELSGRV